AICAAGAGRGELCYRAVSGGCTNYGVACRACTFAGAWAVPRLALCAPCHPGALWQPITSADGVAAVAVQCACGLELAGTGHAAVAGTLPHPRYCGRAGL